MDTKKRGKAACVLLFASSLLILSSPCVVRLAKADDPELSLTVETNRLVYWPTGLVRILGIVKNATNDPVAGAWVGIQVQDPMNGTVFLDIAISSVYGNYSACFRLPSTAILGSHKIYVTASAPQYPTARQQNTFMVTIQGDVNGNRKVDIFDIVHMAGVYGISQPDPRYDPNCDIDDDGDIDILDIVIAAGNYGTSW